MQVFIQVARSTKNLQINCKDKQRKPPTFKNIKDKKQAEAYNKRYTHQRQVQQLFYLLNSAGNQLRNKQIQQMQQHLPPLSLRNLAFSLWPAYIVMQCVDVSGQSLADLQCPNKEKPHLKIALMWLFSSGTREFEQDFYLQ